MNIQAQSAVGADWARAAHCNGLDAGGGGVRESANRPAVRVLG